MLRQKLDTTLPALKITTTMKAMLIEEQEQDPMDMQDLRRRLLAEAILTRQAKRNIKKLLL